ncbi:hypothetical protein [Pseudomonas sp. PDM13]|uniref:hypothetical protein n=1 Tax=Pseudomonas sp. PDM13 TaxID=2769255 RepID=UPI0021DF4860|nr:hypothetical protein [Pseudomonas sp. PDM13]MCU9948877.1 hypothetical protein [Pseudomonas sp. PDM13]
MSPLKLAAITLAALAMSACSTPAPTTTNDNGIRAAAQKLIGQPASKAIELFGRPDQGVGPSSYGTTGGFYAWNRVQTHMTPEQVFISTGKEYVGQRETYVGVGGGGVGGIAQVGSEAVYRETGYYENRTVIDYFCSITLFTDSQDVITDASVVNCMNKQ